MFDEIKDLLVSELSLDPADIKPESELVSDLGVNSIELTDFLLVCEDKFGVKIDDDDSHGFLTVGDIVGYIEKNK